MKFFSKDLIIACRREDKPKLFIMFVYSTRNALYRSCDERKEEKFLFRYLDILLNGLDTFTHDMNEKNQTRTL